MTSISPSMGDPQVGHCDAIRVARNRYDKLERGKSASLRRCRTAKDLVLEGVYWQTVETLGRELPNIRHVVLLFPLAKHRTDELFSFGSFLHRQLGASDGAILRFRRLIDCRDRDELDHRMRAVLRLAASDGATVDWGVLGNDLLWFFAESGRVRRRWAQDFYSPVFAKPTERPTDIIDPTS